jgi:hypothetical protein
MNYQAFTNDSLTMMYEAIRGALAADDALNRQGLARPVSTFARQRYPRNSVFRFRNRSASILPSKQDASPRRGRN